jgi:hypothetical protein
MLSPDEFSVGSIGDVTAELTLVLPRGGRECPMLVTKAPGAPHAVFLSGQFEFMSFECTNNDAWGGILIPNVTIEVDEQSITDSAPLGALIRLATRLDAITRPDGGFPRPVKTPLVVGLPSCREGSAARFAKWRVVLGEGIKKRELISIESGGGSTN